jgi:hypothetical protein
MAMYHAMIDPRVISDVDGRYTGADDKIHIVLGNGQVLIPGSNNTDTADLYDPATGAFSTAGNPIIDPYGHAAVLLKNGNVPLEGGYNGRGRRGSNYRLASLYLP